LSLVKSLVQLHGGSIEARSAGEGMGSQFLVTLPILSTGAAAVDTSLAPASALPHQPPLRILLVDDNVDATATLGLLLRRLGHSVEVAHDGPSALTAAAHFDPQVILLDIGLPGMDGYQVAGELRRTLPRSDAFLVALTGYGQERDRKLSAAAGFDYHMVKPLKLNDLTALLSTLDTAEKPLAS
jgi:CheY-like chemotaxis protein